MKGLSTITGVYEQEGLIMSKLVSSLYKLARVANDIETLLSFKPRRIATRLKNKYIGRKLVRKVWKWPF